MNDLREKSNLEQLAANRGQMRRSIKEFSYFDWSKVKLHENNYLVNQNSDFPSILTKTDELQQQIKTRSLKELPQVITIRYT